MKGSNYRLSRGMPLTSKAFAPSAPNVKIARFSLGTMKPDYELKVQLVSKQRGQITHNAIEAARVAMNKKLSEEEESYHLLVKAYPHVILRENKMIATAGADRLQEGMRRAWGKPSNRAARVVSGTVLFEVKTYNNKMGKIKESMDAAKSKLPFRTQMLTTEISEPKQQKRK
jgi:large subunit ribosomal protein L10e|tara:strand:+ start:867 stop:1382 length:516 start_codon:yes stop_codon:yes gene_type:complete